MVLKKRNIVFSLFFVFFFAIQSNAQVDYDSVSFRLAGYGYQEVKIPHEILEDTAFYFINIDSLAPPPEIELDFNFIKVTNNVWVSWIWVVDTAVPYKLFTCWDIDTTYNWLYGETYDSTTFGIDSLEILYMTRRTSRYQVIHIIPELWIKPKWEN